MADLNYIDRDLEVKIVGQDSTGNTVNYVSADTNGNLAVKDYADGPVTPGTVAAASTLIGGQFNAVLPTLTTAQQAAIQVDSSGRVIVAPTTQGLLAEDHNYGAVGANTLRTAAQIGNTTGAADFNAGATGAQTLRTTANQGAPGTVANAWPIKVTDGTNTAAVTLGSDLQVSPLSRNLSGSGSASALNADLIASTDVNGYQSASVQITGTFIGTITFQGSNDNINFVSLAATNSSSPSTSPTTTTTSVGLFYLPLVCRYIRIRMTSYTSGTATATVIYDSLTPTDLGARNTSFTVLGGQLVPTITNKLRIEYNSAAASTVGSAYSTVFTRSGTGLFFGFQLDFNSANVFIRLTIDGGQIFEVTQADIKLFQFNDTTTTRTQMGGFWTTIGNTLDFSTRYAIPYSSSLLIEVKRSDGTNHTMNNWMVILTEDT